MVEIQAGHGFAVTVKGSLVCNVLIVTDGRPYTEIGAGSVKSTVSVKNGSVKRNISGQFTVKITPPIVDGYGKCIKIISIFDVIESIPISI